MAIYATVTGFISQDAQTFTWGQDHRTGIHFNVGSNGSNAYTYDDGDAPVTWLRATLFRGNEKLAEAFMKGRRVTLIGEIEQTDTDRNGNLYNMQMTVRDFQFGPIPNSNNQNMQQDNQGYDQYQDQGQGGYNKIQINTNHNEPEDDFNF